MPSRATQAASRLLLLLFAVVCAGPALAKYTDTVVLKNGDRITGDVNSLAQGQLSFDTDAMGTVSIEWDKVAEILSEKSMQVETTGGIRFFGRLERPPDDAKVTVRTTESVETVAIAEVVHITPIEHSFWKRIQGSLSAGFTFTKSSDVAQFNLSGNARYRTRRNQVTLHYSNIITDQDSGTTGQLNSQLAYRRLLERRWFGLGFLSFQRNQELGIDGRTLIGVGAGRTIIESRRGELALSAGVDFNLEDTTSGQDTSGEVFGSLDYSLYKYSGNQTNLTIGLVVFPSITESGRVRWQLNSRWRQELFSNLFWDWTIYATGDNEPPLGAVASTDYGTVTSLGWSFGP